MRRDSSFCAKSVRYNIFTNDAPYKAPNVCHILHHMVHASHVLLEHGQWI